jgi:hypothetical protein
LTRITSVALLALLAMVGCSSAEPPTDAADQDPGEIGAAPTMAAQHVGKPFPYQELFTDGTPPVDWEVTVTKVQCGLKVFQNAADNPAYTSGDWSVDDVPPEQIDATPAPGKTFCRMDATMKNAGRTPASGPESFGNLETDQGQFEAGYDEDASISANLLEMAKAPTGPFNPGDTARVVKVWSVPADAKPVAVLFPGESVLGPSSHRITLG